MSVTGPSGDFRPPPSFSTEAMRGDVGQNIPPELRYKISEFLNRLIIKGEVFDELPPDLVAAITQQTTREQGATILSELKDIMSTGNAHNIMVHDLQDDLAAENNKDPVNFGKIRQLEEAIREAEVGQNDQWNNAVKWLYSK